MQNYNVVRSICIVVFVILSIIGLLIGYNFYYKQLRETSVLLLVFVPDCPLYILVALFIYFGLIKNKTFAFVVACGLIKYGLWTEMVFSIYPEYYLSPMLLGATVFLATAHLGMISEFVLFIPDKVGKGTVLVAVLWFLLNDAIDYIIGTMPNIPTYKLPTVIVITIAMSLVVPLISYWLITRYSFTTKGPVVKLKNLFLLH